MNLLQKFQQFIAKENLFQQKDILLLAVSGGIDSVVLCELCKQAGYNFIIAHCNFQLRGQESDRDEEFVKDLGTKYHKQVLVNHFKTEQYAALNKVSIQVAARELRYAWFREILNREAPGVNRERSDLDRQSSDVRCETAIINTKNMEEVQKDCGVTGHVSPLTFDASTQHSPLPTHLVTAHHLNDNIETMLMNFFKGTGIAGLRGILPKQNSITRPLLFAKKDDLLNFATENKLLWVEDSSNQSNKYSRNYFRNQIIPMLKNIYPEAENNMAHNLQRFKDIELLYHQSIALHKKKLLEYKGNEVHIPVMKLLQAVPLLTIVYEIIKDYRFSADQASETIALLRSETGRYIQSATHRIIKNRNWLIISPKESEQASNILIETVGKVNFQSNCLELSLMPNSKSPIPDSTTVALLDAAEIDFPLMLRKWKTGDYFYPLGMHKKKKLSRFFIDQKLSRTAKENVWVLETNRKIIWVIGHRIDDRFKITPSTKQVLKIDQKL